MVSFVNESFELKSKTSGKTNAYRHMCTFGFSSHIRDSRWWPKEQGSRKGAIPFPNAASQKQKLSVEGCKAKWKTGK